MKTIKGTGLAVGVILGLCAGNAYRGWAVSLTAVTPPGTFQPLIVAGGPPDSPAARVDPNTTTSPFAGVGSFFVDVPGPGGYLGSGTAITRNHVLTAAHLFDSNGDGVPDVTPADITFILNYGGDLTHLITASALAVHPDYTGFNNPSVNDDVAVVTLSSPVPYGVPIYPLYPFAVVADITLVGYGRSGDGIAGYTTGASFNIKRSGGNYVNTGDLDDEGSGAFEVFYYDFDPPGGDVWDGAVSRGNAIETMVGPGDSGGPSFIDDGGVLKVYGVNTFSFGSPGPTGRWGDGGGGMFVSAYADWIGHVVPDGGSTLALLALAFGGLFGGHRLIERRK